MKKIEPWKVKHGFYGTRTYGCWRSINKRCYDENNASFKSYGAKGITVANEWRENFKNFLRDMGPAPTEKHTVERICYNGNYEKGNCVWATYKEQGQNRSTNKFISYNGLTLTYSQWAERLGLPAHIVKQRKKAGWDDKRVLETPVRAYNS